MKLSKAEWIGMLVEIAGVLAYLFSLFIIAIAFVR